MNDERRKTSHLSDNVGLNRSKHQDDGRAGAPVVHGSFYLTSVTHRLQVIPETVPHEQG